MERIDSSNSIARIPLEKGDFKALRGYRWLFVLRFLPAWLRDAWGLAGLAVAAGALLFSLWAIFYGSREAYAPLASDLVLFPACLFGLACAGRIVFQPTQEPRARRLWLLFGLGLFSLWLASALRLRAEITLRPAPGPISDLVTLAYYLFILAGLALLPAQLPKRAGRIKFALDLAIVLVAAWLPVWYLLIEPGRMASRGSPLEQFLSSAYPLASLALLAGFLLLLLRRPGRINSGVLTLILIGLVLSLASCFISSYQSLVGTLLRGSWVDAALVAACAFWALAALKARQAPPAEAEEFPENVLTLRVAALLPIVSSGLVYVFVIAAVAINLLHGQPIAGLLVGGTVLTSLVLLRLVLEMGENQYLKKELARSSARLQLFSWEHDQGVVDREQDIPLAAKVGQRLSKLSDLDSLVKDAVALIQERFDLYYVQVYLVDAGRRRLVLQAGSGQAGQELLQRSHQLPVNLASIPGTAAVEKRPVIAGDTANSLIYHSNPLLPDTRSEIALPLVVDDQLVGILDMHSTVPETFTMDRLPAFESVASRLAVAIANARLFAEVEQAREEVLAQTRRLARHGWQNYLNALERSEHTGYSYEQGVVAGLDSLPPASPSNPPARGVLDTPIQVLGAEIGKFHFELDEPCTAGQVELAETIAGRVAQQADNLRLLAQAERYQAEAEGAVRRLTRQGWEGFLETQAGQESGFLYDQNVVSPWSAGEQDALQPAMGFDLTVQAEAIGELSLAGVEELDEESTVLLESTARLLSEHLENLRLYSSAQQELVERRRAEATLVKRASELATVAQLSTTVTALSDRLQVMQTVVDLAREAFTLYHSHIYALDDAGRTLVLAAGAGQVGRQMVAQGWEIPLDRKQSLVARAARTRQGVIVNDVRQEPDFLPNPLLPDTRAEMAVPILAGERVLGVLDVQSDVPGRFTQEDVAIQTTLAAQVAVALENARLFQQVQRQADQEALINSISQKIQSTTTVETALQVAIRELGRALGAQRTSVHLDVTRKAVTSEDVEPATPGAGEPHVAAPQAAAPNTAGKNGR